VRIGGPNFQALAEAYGIPGITVRTDAEIRPAIERARSIRGPVLIDFVIEPEANVWPMVPPGGANSEMLHHRRYEG
jgi:acetolactate synthase-1/2/3 large subunit